MDGHDRKELSAAAMSRQEWLDKYGSFLFCPERDTLCVHMDGMWMTGCERPQCILDDPEYQILQKRIEANREAADAAARKERKKALTLKFCGICQEKGLMHSCRPGRAPA